MKRTIALAMLFAFISPAFSHELTIKAKDSALKAGEPFHVTVQSAHKFIVPEEVEVLSRVKAGIIEDGKLVEAELTGNDPELCIDFTVTPKNLSHSIMLAAIKDGETYCVTNEGERDGSRKDLEAQGLKVIRATKNDKYAKALFNTSHDDTEFARVLGHPLEIIPVTNPANAKVGSYFDVKIILNGQP